MPPIRESIIQRLFSAAYLPAYRPVTVACHTMYEHSGKALFEDINSWVALSEISAFGLYLEFSHQSPVDYILLSIIDKCYQLVSILIA